MIEAPGAASGPLGLRESGVEIRIDIEPHRAGFPLDGVEMKSVGKILAGGQAEGCAGITRLGYGARAVERSVNRAGFSPDVFHDVDFAALWPPIRGDVVAEHPKGGPHPLSCGDFNARFESSVS